MFDLDAPENTLPAYEFKFEGKEYKFDTVTLIDKLGKELTGVTDPVAIGEKLSKILNIPLTPSQAVVLLSNFREFSDKYEALVGKIFGRSQLSPTTTDSTPSSASGLPESAPELCSA